MSDSKKHSWIPMIPYEESTGVLREQYDFLLSRSAWIAHVLKIHSLMPEMISHVMKFYLAIMFSPQGIRRRLREMIAVVVSAENHCHY